MLKKNIFYNTILQISHLIFPLISFPYVSRVLQPAGIGAVSLASNFTQYFLAFAALGIPIYGVREIAKVSENKISLKKTFSELIYINLITTCIVSILFLIIIFNLKIFFSEIDLFMIGFGILWVNLFFIEWYYKGIQNFKFITIRLVSIRMISLILIFTLVTSPSDKDTYYLIELIVLALNASINFYYARHLFIFDIKKLKIFRHLKPVLTLFSLSIMVSIYVYANTILLGFLTNNIAVGYYTIAEKVNKLSLSLIGTAGIVLLPRLSQLFANKNKENLQKAKYLLEKSLRFTLFLSIPVTFGVFCYAKELILIISGENFLKALIPLKVLSPLAVLLGIAYIYSRQILFPLGKENIMLKLSVIGMFFNILVNLMLIPKLSYVGTAITYLSTQILMVLLVYSYSRKFFKIKFPLKQLILSATICILFFFIRQITLIYTSNVIIIFLIGIALCFTTYTSIQLFVFKDSIALEILATIKDKLKATKKLK